MASSAMQDQTLPGDLQDEALRDLRDEMWRFSAHDGPVFDREHVREWGERLHALLPDDGSRPIASDRRVMPDRRQRGG